MRSSRCPLVWCVAVAVLTATLAGCGEDSTTPDTGRLDGWVVLKLTDDPLPGVRVACAGQERVTGADGRFVFERIPQGEQLLEATRDEYRPYAKSIQVTASATVGIELAPIDSTTDLSGHVLHRLDGAVAQALVSCAGRQAISQPPDGAFLLTDVPMGRRELSVDQPSYLPVTVAVTLASPVQQRDVYVRRAATIEVPVTRDADLRASSEERDQNYGALAALTVSKRDQSWALIGLPDIGVPPASYMDIREARLSLHVIWEDLGVDGGYPSCFKVFRAQGQWTEFTVTFATAPTIDDTAPVFDYSEPNCWPTLQQGWNVMELDLTAMIESMQGDLVFQQFDTTGSEGAFLIGSSENPEADLQPRLVLEGDI